MSNKYHIRKRMFLNRELDMPAMIVAIVEDTSEHQGKSEDFYYGDISLTLSDCYRQVSYDFSLCSKVGRRAALYKIRRLAKTINAFCEALEKEVELIEAVEKPKAESAKA